MLQTGQVQGEASSPARVEGGGTYITQSLTMSTKLLLLVVWAAGFLPGGRFLACLVIQKSICLQD